MFAFFGTPRGHKYLRAGIAVTSVFGLYNPAGISAVAFFLYATKGLGTAFAGGDITSFLAGHPMLSTTLVATLIAAIFTISAYYFMGWKTFLGSVAITGLAGMATYLQGDFSTAVNLTIQMLANANKWALTLFLLSIILMAFLMGGFSYSWRYAWHGFGPLGRAAIVVIVLAGFGLLQVWIHTFSNITNVIWGLEVALCITFLLSLNKAGFDRAAAGTPPVNTIGMEDHHTGQQHVVVDDVHHHPDH